MRVLAIDVGIGALQLLCLTVSYLTSHPHSAVGSLFPYSDPLLPPTISRVQAYTRLSASEEGYAEKSIDEDEAILGRSSSPKKLIKDVSSQFAGYAPVIFNLSLSHLCRVVLYYPSPPPQEGPRSSLLQSGSSVSSNQVQSAATEGRLPGQWVSPAT